MPPKTTYYHDYVSNYKIYLEEFYRNLNRSDFKSISVKKILELKAYSKQLNKEFDDPKSEVLKTLRYLKIIDRLKLSHKQFNLSDDIKTRCAERYLLFMFSVDPSFEAAVIFGQCDTIKEIKKEMIKTLGIYDLNLVHIENFYLKNFASEKKKEEIRNKIKIKEFK